MLGYSTRTWAIGVALNSPISFKIVLYKNKVFQMELNIKEKNISSNSRFPVQQRADESLFLRHIFQFQVKKKVSQYLYSNAATCPRLHHIPSFNENESDFFLLL